MRSFSVLAYRKGCSRPKLRLMFVCHVGILGFLTGLFVMLAGPSAQGQTTPKRELRVAAASDLQPVMPTLAAEYEKAKGVKLVVSYGASATLATQIMNGAPIDITGCRSD